MYKIKSRIVEGKVRYGIIDEDLKEIAEFKYKKIIPIEGISNVFFS